MYLDDIVIYSSTQEEHVKHLQAVLEHFRLHGLKLKLLKCEFFKEKIEFLEHSVSSKGVWLSRDNLKAIAKYPKLMMYVAIKGFIRLMGHYRHFIKDFAKITDPLHECVRGDTAKKKKEWVVLNEAARSAFHKLKKAVMSAPVLAYPDPNKEYLLKTDASSGCFWEEGFTWSGGQLPQYKTQVYGHEMVHQTFSDLSTGSPLQSPHR